MSEAPELAPESIEDVSLQSILDEAAPVLGADGGEGDGFVRDEHGRFAPKVAASPELETTPAPEASPAPAAPAAQEPVRLTADEWAKLQTRPTVPPAAVPQPQAEAPKPEFWENPLSAVEHLVQQKMAAFENQMLADRVAFSEERAISQHGLEAVQAAGKAIEELARTNPAEANRLAQAARQSRDPIGDIMRWHKRSEALKTVGDDPQAWFKSQIAAAAADPAKRAELIKELGLSESEAPALAAPSASAAPQRVVLPPSLSKVPAGRALQTDGDDSLESLLRH